MGGKRREPYWSAFPSLSEPWWCHWRPHSECVENIRTPPYRRQAWSQDSCKSDIFLGRRGLGVVSALPRPPSWWEGGPLRCPPQKLHPRIGPSGHVTGVPANFEILATPLQSYCTLNDDDDDDDESRWRLASSHIHWVGCTESPVTDTSSPYHVNTT